MNALKRAWQRGETVEYRERGAEGDFWFLDPPEWDETRYEYREYRPLPVALAFSPLSLAKQRAVDEAARQVEAMRQRQQREAEVLQFNATYKPLPWWRRVLLPAMAWASIALALTVASWMLGHWVTGR